MLFCKVGDFNMEEIKSFSTNSLITRTTNDITQVQMFLAMGIQILIKSPLLAVWAIFKVLNKSWEWTLLTAGSVLIILIYTSIKFASLELRVGEPLHVANDISLLPLQMYPKWK